MNIDWDRGPIASLMDPGGSRERTSQQQPPSIWGGAATGARYGSFAGPAGTIAGGIVGAFKGWLDSRNWSSQQSDLASMSNDHAQPDTGAGVNWDVSLGDPQSAGVRSGPPSNLAGGTLGQLQDGDPPAWYEDTTMNADDPMGLVPDYGQDGPAQGERGPEARRDGNGWNGNTGVSSMQVNGQNVIIGQDPNQMYTRRLVDYGG